MEQPAPAAHGEAAASDKAGDDGGGGGSIYCGGFAWLGLLLYNCRRPQ